MTRHKHKLSQCPNCETSLGDDFEFCPKCGQENHDIILPISHLGYEFIEGFTHFDTKIFNTLKSMFTKPGEITVEFLAGKRAKYVPPPRFYIFISVIFFLLLGKIFDKTISKVLREEFQKDKGKIAISSNERIYKLDQSDWEYWLTLSNRLGDSLLLVNKNPLPIERDSLRKKVYEKLILQIKDTIEEEHDLSFSFNRNRRNADITINNDSTELKESLQRQNERIKKLKKLDSIYLNGQCIDTIKNEKQNKQGILEFTEAEIEEIKFYNEEEIDSLIIARGEKPNWLLRNVIKRVDNYKNLEVENILLATLKTLSICMFFLMPFVALITFLLFKKSRKYYVEHLINSILLHSFYFTFFSIIFILGLAWPDLFNEFTLVVIGIGSWAYLLKSLKVVFNNSWTKTIVKLFIINLIYSVVLLVIMVGAFIYGALTF